MSRICLWGDDLRNSGKRKLIDGQEMTSVQETKWSLDYPEIIELPEPCRLDTYSQKRMEAEPRTKQSRKQESDRGQARENGMYGAVEGTRRLLYLIFETESRQKIRLRRSS